MESLHVSALPDRISRDFFTTRHVRSNHSSARLGSARLGSVRFGSVRFGSVRFGSIRFASIRFGSVRLGSARNGSALGSRLSARLGSARLGSTRYSNYLFEGSRQVAYLKTKRQNRALFNDEGRKTACFLRLQCSNLCLQQVNREGVTCSTGL